MALGDSVPMKKPGSPLQKAPGFHVPPPEALRPFYSVTVSNSAAVILEGQEVLYKDYKLEEDSVYRR
jgi:hypothetical protein